MTKTNTTPRRVQPLNYCRQMVKQFGPLVEVPSLPPVMRERMQHCLTLSSASQKFLLPTNGHLIDDMELRALDEDQKLHLPFGLIALEYTVTLDPEEGAGRSSKRIIFASELDDGIAFRCVAWIDAIGLFQPYAGFMLKHGQYLFRGMSNEKGVPTVAVADMVGNGDGMLDRVTQDSERADINYEARVLLGVMNALSCSNVHVDKLDGSEKIGKKVKSALPFDSYHVLTIDTAAREATCGGQTESGSHRSPREHLRRGHIRRYQSGLKTWVNATLVNPGVGGKVDKDYRLAA